MNIIYISSLCSKHKYMELFNKSTVKPGQQVQKYHRLLVNGLSKNEGVSISVISGLPVSPSVSRKLLWEKQVEYVDGVKYTYLPFINMPVLRNIILFISCFIEILQNCHNKNSNVIISDVLNISLSYASIFASRINKVKTIGIITDIPRCLMDMENNRFTGIKLLIRKLINKINTYVMNTFASYVFLTKYMSSEIKDKAKPFIVLEGHTDIGMNELENNLNKKHEKKVCIYAGSIKKIYGINMLIEAFLKIKINDSELHIYGDGDYREELIDITKINDNIKYFGEVHNDIVVAEELKATLLINPRPTNEEYTQYSFPSKNMEYMASGTPVLTTKLPGMPIDYYNHVYLIEEETIDGLAKNLEEVLSKDKCELHKKGIEAKRFVIKEKSNVVQAKKIIDMIKINCKISH